MTLRQAVVLTVAYSAQFAYPLSTSELWLRLLQPTSAFSQTQFVGELRWLVRAGWLEYQSGYIFLSGHAIDIERRRASAQRASEKRKQISLVVWLCRRIPWITGVAVTGSVAVAQARATDDLDFLVVTTPNRLWLTRLVLVSLSVLLGKYRSRNNTHTTGWCFNMWLENSDLGLPITKHTVYTAYEVLQADWVLQKFAAKKLFLLANAWVARVLPRGYQASMAQCMVSDDRSFWRVVVTGVCMPVSTVANFWAYVLQHWYMRSIMTREVVHFSQAYFHPRDTHQNITSRWCAILEELS
ncbi:MAG: hypothetical protein A2632_00100 [Candidatus Pacebacteria bacterium RIFCSPHIGHO2_01_FULL_46_16]|nr:MAG: hypothetical protein A2632_00100 [Candidatus Pacebacteria bacterium RIFCSPHIGHO2_01_FULL_46_16]OGJ39209.1 MAG: hypothetical protein A3A82_00180 [Candidatus Pacebacteria bacterium RIFCSPLOWO2_01_FULL_47_12]